jgi:hypothetical protein
LNLPPSLVGDIVVVFNLDVEQKVLVQRKLPGTSPDMAPQDFNPWLVTFDHVLFVVSYVANALHVKIEE